MPKPKLIIVTGRAGSGKTTLAKKLGENLYLPVLSRDELKEGYVNTFNVRHDRLPPETNKIVTEAFFKMVELILSNQVSVVIEAAFQHGVWKSKVEKFQKLSEAIIVICEIEPDIAAKRHLERGLQDAKREFFHGDNRVSHFKKTGEFLSGSFYEAPKLDARTIKVSTIDGYSPNMVELISLIKKASGIDLSK